MCTIQHNYNGKRESPSHLKFYLTQQHRYKSPVSWNRPDYKSTSLKTITEAIKFSNLSPYNSGSPRNHKGFQTKPRATKIVVIQHNTAFVTTVHKLLQTKLGIAKQHSFETTFSSSTASA
jgi:hypothetical protein